MNGSDVTKLKTHEVTLRLGRLVLRPTTEDDWDILLKWNSDAEVLYYTEGNDVTAYCLADVQRMYRRVSIEALCFIIERDGVPIGEAWLQQMNLARILGQHPDQDCRRIDLMIGEKAFWGQGIGTLVIRMLTRLALEREGADLVYGCDIADCSRASLRAFQKAGYRRQAEHKQAIGAKAMVRYDFVCGRECWLEQEG
jgi:aminoglycoside 6'-N-acetyltransferase